MNNTRDILDKIYELNDELSELLEIESGLYKKALDDKDKETTITRKNADGEEKTVAVTIGELLEEVRVVPNGTARKELKKHYPELFEAADKRAEKNQELNTFIQQNLGINPHEMSIPKYLRLTEMLIDYKLEEK